MGERSRVLLVEDSDTVAKVTTLALEPEYDVERCASLDDALDALRQRPDAVLLDLGLPDSSGLATLETFLRAQPACAVVVFTATGDDLGSQAIRAGAHDYLWKDTVNPDLLRRTVRHAMERRRLEVEQRQGELGRRLVRRIFSTLGASGVMTGQLRRELGRQLAADVGARDVEESLDAFRRMGFGQLEVRSRSGERSSFLGSGLVEVTPGAGRANCLLALGFLEGVLGASGGGALGTETRCQSQGHPHCEFHVKLQAEGADP